MNVDRPKVSVALQKERVKVSASPRAVKSHVAMPPPAKAPTASLMHLAEKKAIASLTRRAVKTLAKVTAVRVLVKGLVHPMPSAAKLFMIIQQLQQELRQLQAEVRELRGMKPMIKEGAREGEKTIRKDAPREGEKIVKKEPARESENPVKKARRAKVRSSLRRMPRAKARRRSRKMCHAREKRPSRRTRRVMATSR